MLVVALPKGSREATMCKGFGSTLTGPALQWYINLPSRSIASFAVLSDKFVEQFASSRDLEKTSDSLYEILQHRAEPLQGHIARLNQEKVAIPECSIPTAVSVFKTGLLRDGDLYKDLTKYQCKTMEDVLSRAWAQVKWEEDVASRAKDQKKPDPKTIRPDRTERDEKPSQRSARDCGNRNWGMYQNRPITKAEWMAVSMWPHIFHLSVSRPELVNVLRQMGQQVKWPQKMKAPDFFRNPGFWCDFPRDHDHKTEDCIALEIEVNELLRKGHLREFFSDKAKSHLSKETTCKPTEAAPVSPQRQDRVIHVILGGLEISGISHAAAKKSTWNAKHGLEAAKPKCLLLGIDEISFTAKEQDKVLTPHHDALVISLTVANCLVKSILVDNGSSGNIIFQAAYKDLGVEEGTLTRRSTSTHTLQAQRRRSTVALPKRTEAHRECRPGAKSKNNTPYAGGVGEKYAGIEFLQTPGRTPASGSLLEGTPVPRIPARRNPGSPLWSFPSPVPGSSPSFGKWKTSDKENLSYFRIWKSLTYSNRLSPALGRLYKGNLNPKARDRHFET
ncbi:hypothetical protein F2Q70_00002826 [Brassica cretica]|uniref:Retrotransposon gag domain-containing protein n=1 Tax=Brassica cretica TaxID=69181 RepID=A0A8S9IQ24_BRACR|nr:hypothetical protein F2Q70_00002826 [Brassica cretica]